MEVFSEESGDYVYGGTGNPMPHAAVGPLAGHKVDGGAEEVVVPVEPVRVSVAAARAVEGSAIAFPVTLSRAADEAVTVAWATGDGTALAGADYTAASGILTLEAGAVAKTVSVPTIADTRDEEAETLTLSLFSATGAQPVDSARSAVGTIVDDDDPPSLNLGGARVTEGGTAVLALALAEPSARQVTVSWSTADGTATAGEDYTAQTSGAVVFAPGTVSATLRVVTVDDTITEVEETLQVRAQIQPYEGEEAPPTFMATVTILDDGDFSAVDDTGTETPPAGPTATIWTTTITVGSTDGGTVKGFSRGQFGSLAAPRFMYADSPYEAIRLALGNTTFELRLDAPLPPASLPSLFLKVGARYYALSLSKHEEFGTEHQYILFQASSDHFVGWSDAEAFPVALLALTTPSEPIDLTAAPAGTRAADLSWTAPRVTGNGGIAGYRIEASDDGGVAWRVVVVSTGNEDTAWRDATLLPTQTRRYRVRAISESGRAGPAAGPVSVTAPPGIRSIEISSAPAQGGAAYLEGETIEVTATFTSEAELYGAAMSLELGDGNATAACVETGGRCLASPAVVFRKAVQAGDVDADGIGWSADPIAGIALKKGNGPRLNLEYPRTGPLDAHRVDGRALTVSVADAADVAEGVPAMFDVTLSHPAVQEIEVIWSTSGGTATAVEDYAAVAAQTYTFAPGEATGTLAVSTVDDALDEAAETVTVTLASASRGAEVVAESASASATIIDGDDTPLVMAADVSVAEGEDAVLAVTLSAPSGREVVVSWETADATATAGTDYTAVSGGALTFAPGETQKTLTVSTIDNTFREGAETFLVRLQRRAYAGETAPKAVEATVTLTDESDLRYSEGGAIAPASPTEEVWSATVTVGFNNNFYGYFSAEYGTLTKDEFSYGGTPHQVERFEYDSMPVETINNGRQYLQFRTVPELAGAETVDGNRFGPAPLVLKIGERYFAMSEAGSTSFGYYVFSDFASQWQVGDTIEVALLALTDPTVPTGLSARTVSARTVDLSWTAPSTAGATAADGAASTAGYRIEASDDGGGAWRNLVANTLSLSTSHTDSTVDVGTTRHYRVSAINDRGAVGPASGTTTVSMAHGVASIEVTSTPARGDTYLAGEAIEVTVTFSTEADIIADAASMPLLLGGATVTTACMETSGRCLASPAVVFRHVVQTNEVDADGIGWDADALVGEVYAVGDASIVNVVHPASGPFGGHKVDGRVQTVSIADAVPAEVEEGDPATFEVTLLRQAAQEVEVTWSTSDGTATAGEDYTAVVAGTLSIAAGQSSGMLTVSTLDDALDEIRAETLDVRLDSVSGGTAVVDADASAATATLVDNDPIPVVTVAAVSVAEGEDAVLAVTLSAPSGREVVVSWETVDGTAMAGADYTAAAGQMLTFAPGETQLALTISTIDDTFREGAETFLVRLQRRAYGAETAPDAVEATVTVEADEDQIFSAGGIVAPGAATETVWSSTLTVGRLAAGVYGYFPVDGGDIGELPERTFVREGTSYAVANIQYQTELQFLLDKMLLVSDVPNLILQVGERYFPLSGARSFSAAANHGYGIGSDPLGWSANDEVALALLAFTHPEEPTDLRATAAGPRAVDLAWTAPEVTGSGGIAGYRIERWDDGGGNWTELVADTADAGTTYRDETLIPGETRDYRVSAINGLGNIGPPSVPASGTSEHGVRSIEVTSTPAYGETYLAGEAIEVTATLNAEAELVGSSMPLLLGSAPVTAACVETAGDCLASPAVVFRHLVQVDELDADGIAWAADSIAGTATATADASAVNLSHAAYGPLGGHKVDGRALTVSVADAADVTEGDPATFEVALSRAVDHEIEVIWSTSDGTATAGEDYTAVSAGTLTLAPGAITGTLAVPTLDDVLDEAAEMLMVTLASASGGAAVDETAASASMTIIDDDDPPLLTAANVSVAEGEDAVLAVTLSALSGREVVVSWETADATATAGTDYTAVAGGALTFAPGETRQTLTVSTIDDTFREGAETFLVRLQRRAYAAETAPGCRRGDGDRRSR